MPSNISYTTSIGVIGEAVSKTINECADGTGGVVQDILITKEKERRLSIALDQNKAVGKEDIGELTIIFL